MPDLPAWLQEIRDRAEAATPGPWRVVAHGEQDCLARREITAGKHIMIARVDCVPGVAADFDRDYAFIAHARTDVPRLIGLVGEMAKVLEAAREEVREALLCSNSIECGESPCCTAITPCAGVQIDAVYRKYYGEVSSND